jgi:hypothetical protein
VYVIKSTELFEAIEQHDLDGLRARLAQGADPNALQAEWPQFRPLHAAIEALEEGGSMEALILLLRSGAAVDERCGEDVTPLLMAVFRKQREAVRMLLAAGADPNCRGGEGDSPLRWSVDEDDYELAAMLLRCGATKTIDDAGTFDSTGGYSAMTALGRAASKLNIRMIQLLLEAGADPEARDYDRRTARSLLPPRETSDPALWDAAEQLLARTSPRVAQP